MPAAGLPRTPWRMGTSSGKVALMICASGARSSCAIGVGLTSEAREQPGLSDVSCSDADQCPCAAQLRAACWRRSCVLPRCGVPHLVAELVLARQQAQRHQASIDARLILQRKSPKPKSGDAGCCWLWQCCPGRAVCCCEQTAAWLHPLGHLAGQVAAQRLEQARPLVWVVTVHQRLEHLRHL